MKDFLFFRGYEKKIRTYTINLQEIPSGVISQDEYNRRRDFEAHQRYLETYYKLQRVAEERRIEELNSI